VYAVCRKVETCRPPAAEDYGDLLNIEAKAWFIKAKLQEARERELRELIKSLFRRGA
jgi:hypothetical protein